MNIDLKWGKNLFNLNRSPVETKKSQARKSVDPEK